VGRRSPYPMGGELPEEYKAAHDPFVALGTAAAVTTKLVVGTGVCLVAQRDPIILAKEVASLDALSNGRFIFGIGYGWNADELEDHGVAFSDRRAVVRERVLAMQQLWTADVASFHGDHVSFDATWAWPKPVQQPRPPILIGGGAGPSLFRHVAEYADGWMPIGGSGLARHWNELRSACERVGRDPSTVRVTVVFARPDEGAVSHYASLGVERLVLSLPSAPAPKVLPLLDRLTKLRSAAS
jgi:probable F420-dependent oxidoreductase